MHVVSRMTLKWNVWVAVFVMLSLNVVDLEMLRAQTPALASTEMNETPSNTNDLKGDLQEKQQDYFFQDPPIEDALKDKTETSDPESKDVVNDPSINRHDPTSEKKEMEEIEEAFRMQEYRPNYIISGKPDTKVQFSFLFKMLKNYSLYFGFTQTMFWELGQKDSNPFSDINFNPELFYRFKFQESWLNKIELGYAHTSNGLAGTESRSMDDVFLQLNTETETFLGLTKAELRFRYIIPHSLSDNTDLRDYYGPVVLRLHLTRLGRRLFYSEQFYVEYYNGGKYADDFSKNSVRVSFRFKLFESLSAPKFFVQYFNGYGENLQNYNLRDESIRFGLSIGGG